MAQLVPVPGLPPMNDTPGFAAAKDELFPVLKALPNTAAVGGVTSMPRYFHFHVETPSQTATIPSRSAAPFVK
jgi:hypothetical protein